MQADAQALLGAADARYQPGEPTTNDRDVGHG
jgi:hypothetical protein